ncbi:MAG: TRAP transporter large permease subunit, partial [Deinococcota bacterium]|nr:TRAP transporter large permease subunit [Deinococcota bacterium]
GGDPLHFGIIMIITLMMGEITPPFGMVLFAITRVANIAFADLVRGVTPYLIPILVLLVILVIFPQLVTALPGLM